MQGGDEKVERLLSSLHNEYSANQPVARLVDPYAQEIVRYTFALLLKISDSINTWKCLCESKVVNEKDIKKIGSLWATANKMRMTYSEKKKAISIERQGEQWDKELKTIMGLIKDKVELLLKFKSASIEEQEGLMTSRKMQNSTFDSEKEKNNFEKWQDIPLAVAKDENKENSLAQSALLILESDFTSSQLISQLESYYCRGLVLYAAISNCENAITNIKSKSIRSDVLAWIMSILSRSTIPQFHYTQLTTSCGVAFQMLLRSAFFSVINQVLHYISQLGHPKEISSLLDALKWNYSASDHLHINRLRLLQEIGANSPNSIVAGLWGRGLETEDQASEQLLSTFEFVTIKIATRIFLSSSKQKAVSEDISKEAPTLERSRSIFNTGSTAKNLETILKIIFGEIKKVVESYSTSPGIEIKIIENYNDLFKKSKEETEVDLSQDKKKLLRELSNTAKTGYSQDFCIRLLRLLYQLCVVMQEDQQFNLTVNLLLDDTDFLQLLQLLYLGSIQQQYLILQILPLISKFSFENLEKAAARFLETQHKALCFTKSLLLDFLLFFTLEKREGIWFNKVSKVNGNYSISKCTISAIRSIAFINKDIGVMLGSLAQIILFGEKEAWNITS